MSAKKCLLISDMDGTLLNHDHFVSGQNQAAILDLISRGGIFSIASGRAVCSTVKFAGPLGVGKGILLSGAMIYDYLNSQVVWYQEISKDAHDFVWQIMEQYKDVSIQVYSLHGIYLLQDNPIIRQKGIREEYAGIITPNILLPERWLKIVVTGSPQQLETIKLVIKSDYPQLTALLSGRHFCEITGEGVTKGRALRRLLEIEKVTGDDTIAVGDNENDLSMFETAHLSMAVNNGRPTVKCRADYLLPDCNEHPMVQAVKLVKEYYSLS